MFDMSFLTQLEFLLRIFVAMICGGLIGLERERRVKSAGLKTHMIVSVGAALMMIVSKYGFWDVLVLDNIKLDPSRVAAGIVSAIGFLGAGIIFTRGFKINGVTTAAGLWTTVGVGMAVGAGLYFIGVVITLLTLLIQLFFHRIHINNLYNSLVHAHIHIVGTPIAIQEVRQAIDEMATSKIKIKITTDTSKPEVQTLDLNITVSDRNYEKKLHDLAQTTGLNIISIEVEP